MKIKKVKNEENRLEIIFKKGKHTYRHFSYIVPSMSKGGYERVILKHLNQFIESLEWREKHELKAEEQEA
jgi:hypothetical protein